MEEHEVGTVMVDPGVPLDWAQGPMLIDTMRKDSLPACGEAFILNGIGRIINGELAPSSPPCLRASVRKPKLNQPAHPTAGEPCA